MRKLKDRTCLICNKNFQSTWNKKTCSKQCETSYKRLKKFIKKHTKVHLVKLKYHLYKKEYVLTAVKFLNQVFIISLKIKSIFIVRGNALNEFMN